MAYFMASCKMGYQYGHLLFDKDVEERKNLPLGSDVSHHMKVETRFVFSNSAVNLTLKYAVNFVS